LLKVAENSGIRLFLKKSDEVSEEDELKKRYHEVEFAQQIASPIWLKTLLFDGWVERLMTQQMLDESAYYASPQTLPAWKVAWNWWEIDEKSFEDAVAKVEEEFSKREILNRGEMFHVFGLRLLFADIGVVSKSRADVVNECKCYIDDLYNLERLPDPLESVTEDIQTSWGGLGFYDRNTEDFQAIVNHFYVISSEALKQSLPARARELLDLMESNVQDFFRQLCLNNVSASPFFAIPVLAKISPEEFVDRVLASSTSVQRSIFATLEGRYERNALAEGLSDEKPWILAVKHEFEKKMDTMGKMSKYRLKNRIGHSFGKFLSPEEMSASSTSK
jgi:hypothetical protein